MLLLVKLLLAPSLILTATWVGQHRPAWAGVLGGLPAVAGPVLLVYWLQHGSDFLAVAAPAATLGLSALCAHYIVLVWASRRMLGVSALLWAWLAFACTALLLSVLPLDAAWVSPAVIIFTSRLLPRGAYQGALRQITPAEWALRAAAAATLVLILAALSGAMGAHRSGVWSVFPVAGSVLPVFTLLTQGRSALLLQVQGFLAGMLGFTVFGLLLGIWIHVGVWAFIPALLLAVLVSLLWVRLEHYLPSLPTRFVLA